MKKKHVWNIGEDSDSRKIRTGRCETITLKLSWRIFVIEFTTNDRME